MFIGRWEIDDPLTFTVNTHTPSTGAGTDADSDPAYRVYEDETGTAILTGTMVKLDDANTVGFYSEQITLSAANGFEVGKSYTVYVSAVVGGVTGTLSHGFQVEAALATASALATVQADTDNIQTRLPLVLSSGGYIMADVESILDDDGDVVVNLYALFGSAMLVGAVNQNGQTISFPIGVTGYNDDAFVNRVLYYRDGNNAGEMRRIVAYDGTSGVVTLDSALPNGTVINEFVFILPLFQSVNVTAISDSSAAADAVEATIGNLDVAVSSRSTLTAAQVWANATRTLTSFGTLVADVWSNVTRTLTSGGGGATAADIWDYLTSAITTNGSIGELIKDKLGLITSATEITVDSPVDGGTLTVTKAVTLQTGAIAATVPATWVRCFVTVKASKRDADSAALLQLLKSNPASGVNDGLLYVNGQAGTKTHGSLVVDEDANTVEFTVADDATALLRKEQTGYWDIKFILSDGTSTRPVAGRAAVALPATLTI